MPKLHLSAHTRWFLQCLLLSLLVPAWLLWQGPTQFLDRADTLVYDALVSQQDPSTELILVAIDEASLKELGPWPWPRRFHGDLINHLADAGVKAVFLDLLMTEPSMLELDDEHLAASMRRVPVYIPLPLQTKEEQGIQTPTALQNLRLHREFLPPVAVLAKAAAGVGHVSAVVDSDGRTRAVRWWESWPMNSPLATTRPLDSTLSAPFSTMGNRVVSPYLGAVLVHDMQGSSKALASPQVLSEQDNAMDTALIPFAGPTGTYRSVPYSRVLQGHVPADFLNGRIVVVGSTAESLRDSVWTPNAGAMQVISGAEFHLNAIDAMLHGRTIAPLKRHKNLAYALWTAMASMCLLMTVLFSPRWALLGVLALSLGVLAVSALALRTALIWLPPAGPVMALFCFYAMWSWRRISHVYTYVQQRILEIEPLAPASASPSSRVPHGANGAAGLSQVNLRKRMVSLLTPLQGQDGLQQRLESLALTQKRAQNQREQWLRFLSHDIRSPQVSILSLLNIYQRGKAKNHEYRVDHHPSGVASAAPITAITESDLCAGVQSRVQRTLDLLEGFIHLSTAQHQMNEPLHPVLINMVVMEAVEEVGPFAREKNINIDLQLPGSELWVQGQDAMLMRMLSNLLINAVRYSASDTTILVELTALISPCRCMIIVHDQGQGMSELQVQALMNGQSIELSATPCATDTDFINNGSHRPSIGLGLAYVQLAVSRHQASMRVQSQVGQGTQVQIDIPMSSAPSVAHLN